MNLRVNQKYPSVWVIEEKLSCWWTTLPIRDSDDDLVWSYLTKEEAEEALALYLLKQAST